jgi:hypothetical protein
LAPRLGQYEDQGEANDEDEAEYCVEESESEGGYVSTMPTT